MVHNHVRMLSSQLQRRERNTRLRRVKKNVFYITKIRPQRGRVNHRFKPPTRILISPLSHMGENKNRNVTLNYLSYKKRYKEVDILLVC